MESGSNFEEEYIRAEEIEKLRRQRKAEADRLAQEERDKAKRLHWMRCPKCGMQLTEVDYRGVKVDTCFACGGMFFDKDETEKILAYKERGWMDKWIRHLLGMETDFDRP